MCSTSAAAAGEVCTREVVDDEPERRASPARVAEAEAQKQVRTDARAPRRGASQASVQSAKFDEVPLRIAFRHRFSTSKCCLVRRWDLARGGHRLARPEQLASANRLISRSLPSNISAATFPLSGLAEDLDSGEATELAASHLVGHQLLSEKTLLISAPSALGNTPGKRTRLRHACSPCHVRFSPRAARLSAFSNGHVESTHYVRL